jgi:hypothetical protein
MELNRNFPDEEVQITNKYMEKCSHQVNIRSKEKKNFIVILSYPS